MPFSQDAGDKPLRGVFSKLSFTRLHEGLMRGFLKILPILTGALVVAASPALADRIGRNGDEERYEKHERAAKRRQVGELLPLADLLKRLRKEIPGKILEIEFDDDDPPVYEFYVLQPSGRVIEIELDARTGRILGREEKD